MILICDECKTLIPRKLINVSAVALTELSDRAGNGSTDSHQQQQVLEQHGKTTAFRSITKSLKDQEIMSPTLEEFNS